MRKENISLAITFSLLAGFFYAALACLIKLTEAHIPNSMIVFFRQAFSLLIFLPFLHFKFKSYKKLKTQVFLLHLLRAVASLSAMYCLYFAIKYLPLTDAVLLSYTRPLFIPIVVYFWFHKKWTPNTWIGLIVGFLGVLLILKPDKKIFDVAGFIGLLSGMLGGIAFTCIRRLTKTELSDKIIFYYLLLSLPLTSLPLIFSWQTPPLMIWLLLLLIGLVATFYQMCLTRAYQHAEAFKIGSLLYSSIVFAWIFDYFLGNGKFEFTAIIGIFLIIFGSFIALYEQKKIP